MANVSNSSTSKKKLKRSKHTVAGTGALKGLKPAAPSQLHFDEGKSAINALLETPQEMAELGGNYHSKLHLVLARVYAAAQCLASDIDAWQDFCRLPGWDGFKGKRPAIDNRNDALQSCIRVAVGFEDKNASKLASKYFAALSLPHAAGIVPAEVPAYLEHLGGIEQAARTAAKRRREGPAYPLDESIVRLVTAPGSALQKLLAMPLGQSVQVELLLMGTSARGDHEVQIKRVKRKDPKKSGTK